MKEKISFGKYGTRIMLGGWLRAGLCGVSAGSVAALTVALLQLFTYVFPAPVDKPLLPIIVGAAVFAVLTPIFYLTAFRPSIRRVAAELDALGLEERLTTMLQYREDDSYIATRQRRDANEQLSRVDLRRVRFRLAGFVIVAASLFLLGSAFTVANAYFTDEMKAPVKEGLKELFEEPPTYYSVSYIVEDGGIIEGEAEQLIVEGGFASPILAVADDGWAFQYWDIDESQDPERCDGPITCDLMFTAIFAQVEPGDGDGDGDSDEPQEPQDTPQDESQQSQQGGGEEEPEDGDPQDAASGMYADYNQIIDGETYYRSVYQEYYERAMQTIAEGGEISPEMRAIIEAYFGIIL